MRPTGAPIPTTVWLSTVPAVVTRVVSGGLDLRGGSGAVARTRLAGSGRGPGARSANRSSVVSGIDATCEHAVRARSVYSRTTDGGDSALPARVGPPGSGFGGDVRQTARGGRNRALRVRMRVAGGTARSGRNRA